MLIERTLSIIKPDAIRRNLIGQIITRFESSGLKIIGAKMTVLSKFDAESFYSAHKEREFFPELVEFMISGPIFVQILEGMNAVQKNRELMGDTNPNNAKIGTIRKDFAMCVSENAVHGSDSLEAAQNEIKFFFQETEIFIHHK